VIVGPTTLTNNTAREYNARGLYHFCSFRHASQPLFSPLFCNAVVNTTPCFHHFDPHAHRQTYLVVALSKRTISQHPTVSPGWYFSGFGVACSCTAHRRQASDSPARNAEPLTDFKLPHLQRDRVIEFPGDAEKMTFLKNCT
jgi:hypothetical protein